MLQKNNQIYTPYIRDGCCEIPDIRVPAMTYPAAAKDRVGRYAWQAVFYSDTVEVKNQEELKNGSNFNETVTRSRCTLRTPD